jgi:hypothetical protein
VQTVASSLVDGARGIPARCARWRRRSSAWRRSAIFRSSSSATSRRTGRSRGRACWSTWSTSSATSRATGRPRCASSAP